MRVVFFGTPRTAVPTLDSLLDHGHQVVLVVTQPDRPSGRSMRPQPPPVKERAIAAGLTVSQPVKPRDPRVASEIARTSPEALVVVAYGRILPPAILAAAPHGAINVHFSLLPELRGAAPVPWALARGYAETGVTTFRLDEGLDTGPLLLQERMPIAPHEHAPALLDRLAGAGARLLITTLTSLAEGRIAPLPQDDRRATQAPILTRADGFWDERWGAAELEGRVRGFDPWPGVWVRRQGKRIRIVSARALAMVTGSGEPGTLLGLDGDAMRIACAGRTVAAIETLQVEGRRAVTAREAASGRQIAAGDRLERIEPAA